MQRPATQELWVDLAKRQGNFQRKPINFMPAYQPHSPEYQQSLTHAALPPIYERRILHFYGSRLPLECGGFLSGHIITVTIDVQNDTNRRAYYGIVVAYAQQTPEPDASDENDAHWDLIVEVHTILGYEEKWHTALPWNLPPVKCAFVQPHAFKRNGYRHLSLTAKEYQDVVEINVTAQIGNYTPWGILNLPIVQPTLPPPEAYPIWFTGHRRKQCEPCGARGSDCDYRSPCECCVLDDTEGTCVYSCEAEPEEVSGWGPSY
jgi:hypothetical protein